EEKKECRCDALHAFRSENSTGRCLEKKVLRDPQFGGFRTGVSRFFDSNEVVEGGTIIPIWDSTLPQESEEIFRLGIGLLAADVNWGGRSMVQYSKNAPNLAETLVAAAFAYRLDGESMANPIATGAIPPALWEGNILFVAPALGAVEVLESLKENDRIDFESFKKPRRMANDPTYSDFLKGIETAYKVFRNTETFEFTEFKLKGLAGCAESCLLKMPLEIIASDDLNSYLLVRYDYGAISYQGIHLSQTVGDITRRAVLVLNAAKTVSFLDLIEARAVPKTRKINEAHVVFDRYGNLVTKMQRQTLRSEYEKSLW
ncbi:MAG TPA: hypothetical protein PLH57_09045, partial [Oligoflexia bacterium]|nr:hypothetical protein [Oligoflexia bacterium]